LEETMNRIRLVLAAFALTFPCLAQAVDPPAVQPGECLYLLGGPPGAPAATVEVTNSGTRIYDNCAPHVPHAGVGRDAPHRLTAWAEFQNPAGFENQGCLIQAWSEHEFRVDSDGPAWIHVSAAGRMTALLRALGASSIDKSVTASLVLELRQQSPDGGDRVIALRPVVERGVVTKELVIDDPWGLTLAALVPSGGVYRARLQLEIDVEKFFREADVGSVGSGRGAGYDSIEVCVTPMGNGATGLSSEIERDLHDKRCIPSLWLPAARGGRLEEAHAIVQGLTDAAEASGEPGANTTLARERLQRADDEAGRGQYQRACRSLSDALRGLTSP
jgi:hypothetical protein